MTHSRLFAAAALAAASPTLAQPCQPHWDQTFVGLSPDAGVHALAAIEDDAGRAVYAGGMFTTAGGVLSSLIARWDGQAWSPVGSGIPTQWNSHGFNGCCAQVLAIAPGPAGSPRTVHIAGDFVQVDGQTVESIADRRLGAWHPLAGGVATTTCFECPFRVHGLLRSGPALYAAGGFDQAGGVGVGHVARWDGAAWHALGTGLGAAAGDPFPTWAEKLAEYAEGGATNLFAVGRFSRAGSVDTNCIARWDGQAWSAVGGGFQVPASGAQPSAAAAVVYNDGSGPALYVGGQFRLVGGVQAFNLAKWNGAAWASVGSIGSGPNDQVHALAVFDDGRGPALYVGGTFAEAGGVPASNIARWDGVRWEPLGTGVEGGEVRALLAEGRGLNVGGWFTTAGGLASPYLARWAGCEPTCYANCDGSTAAPILNVNDFVCFQTNYAAGNPGANCDGSTAAPILSVNDFICFQTRFAAGCP